MREHLGYWYLGSPYSHTDEAIRIYRYEAAMMAVAYLLKNNIWVYSPIVHCHELSVRYKLPTDAKFWEEYNFSLLRPSKGLFILTIDGWQESKGLKVEQDWATNLSLKTYKVNKLGMF